MLDIEKYVSDNNSIICVKETGGKVLYQNQACTDLCGDMISEGQPCEKNCMLRYTREADCPEREEGTQYFPCEEIENNFYDILFINDNKTLISILYTLKQRFAADLNYFTQYDLTPKELQVVSQIIKRIPSKDICNTLNFSQGTLKTHINNIYKKLPEEAAKKFQKTYRKI